jgi:hypothetical protein
VTNEMTAARQRAVRQVDAATYCFRLAAAAACIGMTLGIYMGIAQDFTLSPVHAHLNLLGWVSMFLYGLYHRTHPACAGKLATVQVSLSSFGAITMPAGLAGMLLDLHSIFFAATVAGSLAMLAGAIVFLTIVLNAD